ncbi:GNAT family N-acetyltransferase [Biostraticola tofi]|uniref:Acetyltransferase (GNAT) family protein n=1 Tax=Biostraticola tofi TaxID=466109 RepID=A0A4R3Z303_9GAMM|nr:GNAT family N-acetyltransferase [Biostraticola tofi]TCW00172.1 acetyltransferase (GNAT) family protein [Biostraticola tofi]
MDVNITDNPTLEEKNEIIDELWKHNQIFHPVDINTFIVSLTNSNEKIIAGLIAQTWWGALDIKYLWVNESYRYKGYGSQMMNAAEVEAEDRGCHMAYVDTFDFQAKQFYEKLGYSEYGSLGGFARKFKRHYLAKVFTKARDKHG